MASMFPAIYDIIQKNPFKDTTIKITLRRDDSSTTAQGFNSETWDIFTLKPIQPPGPLSFMLWHMDSMYALGTPALRKQIQTEKVLELHGRVDTELVGRRWPRKKIQDHLATQVSASAPNASPMMEEVLCELFQVQKVSLSRKTKTIQFFPADLRNWTPERLILVGDDDNCWSYETSSPTNLVDWIQQKEEQGWRVSWPTADGKMEDLKTAVTQKGLTVRVAPGSDSQKVKKEDYARILGRADTISILHRLGLRIQ